VSVPSVTVAGTRWDGGGAGPAGRRRRHLALVGPTASGKSALGHAAAVALGDVEIISVDSMQVYEGMDVGTAKATPAERSEVRYHLLDVASPAESYTVGAYQRAAEAVFADIERRGHRALLVGGTGLYLQALVDELQLPGCYPAIRQALEAELADRGPDALHEELKRVDPAAAGRIEPSNGRRTVRALEVWRGSGRPFSSFGPGLGAYPPTGIDVVALAWPRPQLDRRIAARYERQLAAGFLDEVRRIAARPGGFGPTARQALGYRELLAHLDGCLSLRDAVEQATRRTRRLARRQERWFRRDPRIRWLAVQGNPMAFLSGLLESWAPCD
jgi:tRNA dimethylallyltransferase